MARRRTFRDGDAEVVMDGELEAMAEAMLQGTPGVIADAMEREADRIEAGALETWPVQSGTSRDAFRVVTRLSDDAIETFLENTAPYAYKIKFSKYTEQELERSSKSVAQRRFLEKKHGKGAPTDRLTMRSVWGELVRKPARKSEKKLAEELEADLLTLADE